MLATPTAIAPVTRNLITDYYDVIAAAAERRGVPGGAAGTPDFAPDFSLPALDERARRFFEAASASWSTLGAYRGHPVHLMDLTGNPGTYTTKTFPSMLIVARAIEHIRRTGDAVRIVTPTSANKGIALRDAVGRAIAAAPHVVEAHDVHVWTVTSGFPALSAHVLVEPGADCHALRRSLEEMLAARFALTHTTLQVDHASPRLLTIEPR